jgi:hypothetical protein
VHLPVGLRAATDAHVVVHARHRAGVRVAGSVVTISPASPSPTIRISLAVRGGDVEPKARLSVGVRAGSTGTSVLTAPLNSGAGA